MEGNESLQRKPRRGGRKKRVVDYYDGPDRDAKFVKEATKHPKEATKHPKEARNKKKAASNPNIAVVDADAQCGVTDLKLASIEDENRGSRPQSKENVSTEVAIDQRKKTRIGKKTVRKSKNVEIIANVELHEVIPASKDPNASNESEDKETQDVGSLKNTKTSMPVETKTVDRTHDGTDDAEGTPPSLEKSTLNTKDEQIIVHSGKVSDLQFDTTTILEGKEMIRDEKIRDETSPRRGIPNEKTVEKVTLSVAKSHSKNTALSANPDLENESIKEGGAASGFAANMASSVKTLLPSSTADTLPKIDTCPDSMKKESMELEMKEMELERQKELDKLNDERLKAEAKEIREKEEVQKRKQEELLARRIAKEEEEKRKREEKARRLEEHKKRRKLEAEAAARNGSTASGLAGPTSATGGSLAAAKERLAKIQQQAAMLKTQGSMSRKTSLNDKTISGTPNPAPLNALGLSISSPSKSKESPDKKQSNETGNGPQHKSYEISPYKSDHDSDDDVPKKPVPDWARGKALMAQLIAQMYVDPDEVFQQHAKTCSLDQVFGSCSKPAKHNFNRRSSSGNWIEDRVTWKEEMGYKKAMGYI